MPLPYLHSSVNWLLPSSPPRPVPVLSCCAFPRPPQPLRLVEISCDGELVSSSCRRRGASAWGQGTTRARPARAPGPVPPVPAWSLVPRGCPGTSTCPLLSAQSHVVPITRDTGLAPDQGHGDTSHGTSPPRTCPSSRGPAGCLGACETRRRASSRGRRTRSGLREGGRRSGKPAHPAVFHFTSKHTKTWKQ